MRPVLFSLSVLIIRVIFNFPHSSVEARYRLSRVF